MFGCMELFMRFDMSEDEFKEEEEGNTEKGAETKM